MQRPSVAEILILKFLICLWLLIRACWSRLQLPMPCCAECGAAAALAGAVPAAGGADLGVGGSADAANHCNGR